MRLIKEPVCLLINRTITRKRHGKLVIAGLKLSVSHLFRWDTYGKISKYFKSSLVKVNNAVLMPNYKQKHNLKVTVKHKFPLNTVFT